MKSDAAAPPSVLDACWSLSRADALRLLAAGPEGLDSAEAAARLQRVGPNRVAAHARRGWPQLLLAQFRSPFILMLAAASVLSAVVGERHDAAIILAIVLFGALLGFVQEHAAASAVARLMALVAVRTTALRDGRHVQVAVEEIVPGDVVLLAAGDMVPADGVLLDAHELLVEEAALTGESEPAEKRPGATDARAGPAERCGALFLGTHVVSGSARLLVARTGRATQFGSIAVRLRVRPPLADFERNVQGFGLMIARVSGVLVLAIFAANVLVGRPAIESLLFSVALAVGMVPEMLPAVVNVTLARGARRMAARRVIVKRLSSIENFGSMNVLCCDKTGTLTEGRVRLHAALDLSGAASDEVLELAAANAGLQAGIENPIDRALVAARQVEPSAWRLLDEAPYDFTRRRLSVLVERRGEAGSERLILTKGALAQVLEVCSHARTAQGTLPLPALRGAIEERFAALSADGLRVLGLAVRPAPELTALTRADERDLTLVGLLAFADPPREHVAETLRELGAAGLRLKVITGDNRRVAAAVARRVGLDSGRVLAGPELRALGADALRRRVDDVDVFAEIDPAQKERIVLALKAAGNVVGYLGDGINDAPALHAADVGLSVDGAADVAKDAADMVLLDKDLGVLLAGVREGRRTFRNTLKYVFITTSANFGNMLSMAVVAAFLPFLPLLPVQILLNNLLTDVPAMALAGDRVDPELVDRPPRWDAKQLRSFMLVFGAISSAFDLLVFAGLIFLLHAGPEAFRSAWFLASVLTELAIVLVMRTRRSFLSSRPSALLGWSTALVAVVAAALVIAPIGGVFGLSPLPAGHLLLVLAATASYTLVSEWAKHAFFRRYAGTSGW